MAQKVSITIALEGGKEIQKQLEDIGEAGKKAFADIGAEADKVGGFKELKPEEVTAKLKELGVTGVDSIKKIQDAVKNAGRLETLVQGIATVENGFAALGRAALPVMEGIAAALVVATKLALSWADGVNKTADSALKLGVGVEQLDKLRAGFEQAGIGVDTLAKGLSKLKEEMDKAKIEQVTKDFEQLQEAATRGFGGFGTAELDRLTKAAQGIGPVADAARKELEKLGQPIPNDVEAGLKKILAASKDVTTGMADVAVAFSKMPDGLQRTQLALKLLGDEMGVRLIDALKDGSFKAEEFAAALQQSAQVTEQQQLTAARTREELEKLSATWERVKAAVLAPIAQPLLEGLLAVAQTLGQIVAGWEAIFGAIGKAASAVGSFVSSMVGIAWDDIKSAGVGAWNAITGAINDAIDAVLKYLGLKPSGDASSGIPPDTSGGQSFAGGGLIGGRGSGTSDSNLAWVSRGEHIMPAYAVAQPGVLAFLEALRSSGGDLRGGLAGLGRFATGGLVTMPALAQGGVGSMSHVTIQFPGLAPITGLRASAAVVDELRTAAAMAQVRSGGRKPSRYT